MGTRKMHMAHTSATMLEARRAVLTVAMALVASTIASAAVITGMIAVIGRSAATSKNYSSYSTAVIPKESGKHMPIRRVVHTRSATAMARAQIPSEFDAVTCGVEKAPPAGLACLADWRLFLAGLPAFELDLTSAMGSGNINQQLWSLMGIMEM
jgi:hypothetical protein